MSDTPAENTVKRLDAYDYVAEEFDSKATEPATKKLIICAAQRSGSHRLVRLLHAADMGTPLEYFNPVFEPVFCRRWGVPLDANNRPNLDQYLDALMVHRAHRGVFSSKMQFWQFDPQLRNETGRRLFDGALVVHLMRADVQMQGFSLHAASATGRWEFTEKVLPNKSPMPPSGLTDPRFVARTMEFLIATDAQWRKLFAYAGISPMLITMDDVVDRPEETTARIAERLGLSFDREGVKKILTVDKKYQTNAGEIAEIKKAVSAIFAREAFMPPPPRQGP